MSKMKLVFGIPLFIAIVTVIAVVVILRSSQVGTSESARQYPGSYDTGTSPTSGGFGESASETPDESARDLNDDLLGTVDDGGKSDFDQLQKDASGL